MYCDERYTREKLVNHIEKNHSDMISEEYTAARQVFNMINKKDHGTCAIDGKETKWREDLWRYERFCCDKCHAEAGRRAKANMIKVYGKETLLNDPEHQEKMLKGRSISGTYKFTHGGSLEYVGSYEKKFLEYLGRFGLDSKRKIKTFSKGMKKQISILLGICSKAKYLLCDETFDGLDPVMRQGIKSIFVQEIYERGLTPIIASHNLRELEDICGYIGVLHQGGILLAKDMEKLRGGLLKVQCVLPEEMDAALRSALQIIKMNRHGKLLTMVVRGSSGEILPVIESMNPVYCEALPLTLEEIFISEMEVVGYDIKNLIG